MRHVVVASTLALALVASFALGGAARAQGNDRSAPTGGRTALMGNTGVALARDGAAPFLNPATIVRIDDQSLAFSVNFYSIGLTHYSNWHQPAPPDPRFGSFQGSGTAISNTRFDALPSTLCLFFTLSEIVEQIRGEESTDDDDEPAWKRGRQKAALCLGSVESDDVNLPALSYAAPTPAGTTSQVASFTRRWNRLHVGPSFSTLLTDQLAVGASIHAVNTTSSFLVDGSAVSSGAAGAGPIQSTLGASGAGHSLDLAAIVGATYRAGRVTLGASLQLPSVHLLGGYDATTHDQIAGAGQDGATLRAASGDFRAPPPLRAAVGVGAESRRLKIEVDASYQFGTSDALRSSMSGTSTSITGGTATPTTFDAIYAVRSRPMINGSAGAEYFVSTGFSLIGGVSTNITTMPPLSPTLTTGNLETARQSSVAVSMGVGSYGAAGDILIGAQLGYGWGESIAVNSYAIPNDWSVVDTQSYSALLILAGATNLKAISRAVERVQNVVTKGQPDAPK